MVQDSYNCVIDLRQFRGFYRKGWNDIDRVAQGSQEYFFLQKRPVKKISFFSIAGYFRFEVEGIDHPALARLFYFGMQLYPLVKALMTFNNSMDAELDGILYQ